MIFSLPVPLCCDINCPTVSVSNIISALYVTDTKNGHHLPVFTVLQTNSWYNYHLLFSFFIPDMASSWLGFRSKSIYCTKFLCFSDIRHIYKEEQKRMLLIGNSIQSLKPCVVFFYTTQKSRSTKDSWPYYTQYDTQYAEFILFLRRKWFSDLGIPTNICIFRRAYLDVLFMK